MERTLTLYPLSSLAKVFLNGIYGGSFSGGSMLLNEEYAYQVGYTLDGVGKVDLTVTVDSPLAEFISLRLVGNVPSELPAFPDADDNYLQKSPGLFPDPLYPLKENVVEGIPGAFHALWVTVRPEGRALPGSYPVRITFSNEELDICETAEVTLEIIDASLPEQELIYTQWFHADCIAAYYGLEIFSEDHWAWIEKFMRTAVENGVNMILTPVFTPPLDTKVGGERPTTQLVDVEKVGESWRFGFDRLERWIETGTRCGVRYFEISHLFTQWGAAHAPKIVARIDGEERRVFGWDTDASGEEYRGFLSAFLPELTGFLREKGLTGRCYFHVSDEPSMEAFDRYRDASEFLREQLGDFPVIDALSEYEFYEAGLVRTPVVATNAISAFIEKSVSPLWGYYCCAQGAEVSNRFMGMPSARNRIIAEQLYKYGLQGFLHWGYNFYYSQFSKGRINPFLTTDAVSAFPSGDSFSVYPGEEEVIEGIGLKVFHEALQDLRAFRLAEERIGKDKVMAVIESGIEEITFSRYPREEEYILSTRECINVLIRETNLLSGGRYGQCS